ncbi:3'5'-cyclic nucleotide phosphodiesterase [Thraustotheca clavata]|uniref:Phosphodiesterase n=1 Tax=Thraustotheca clavata TaxID=74557 RepID=A0A1W0A7L0_9STRA|nr:3'5'-cyclic nucleotide phosphodiesterase [Thraustotheca clavata]
MPPSTPRRVAPLTSKLSYKQILPNRFFLTFDDPILEQQYQSVQWELHHVKQAVGTTQLLVLCICLVVLLGNNEFLSIIQSNSLAWTIQVGGALQIFVWAAFAVLLIPQKRLTLWRVIRAFLAIANLFLVELLVYVANQEPFLISLYMVALALAWHFPFVEFLAMQCLVLISSGVLWSYLKEGWVSYSIHVSFMVLLTRDFYSRKYEQRMLFVQSKANLLADLPNPATHSGMELVLETLCQLRLQHPTTKALDVVLQTLLSETDLFTTLPMEINSVGEDQDVGEWWRLLESTNKRLRKRRESVLRVQSRRSSDLDLQNSIVQQIRVLYPSSAEETRSPTVAQIPSAEPAMFTPEWLLNHCDTGSINVFELSNHCQYPMTSILLATLAHQHLFGTLGVSMGNIAEYAIEIEGHYHVSNPYHNAMHAASVVWDVHQLLMRVTRLKPLQIYSLLLAAAVHDVDHPGVNNTFLINSNHPLALQYSDDSVLERMHLARAFEISRKPGCNPFHNLSSEYRGQCRQMIIQLVLATDLAKHVQHVNHLKSKTYGTTPETRYLDDEYTMRTLLMMADIGHAMHPFDLHHKWSTLIQEEFYRQGDAEIAQKMPVTPLCQRKESSTSKFAKSQLGFFEFIVTPLYTMAAAVVEFTNIQDILDRVEDNAAAWRQQAEALL